MADCDRRVLPLPPRISILDSSPSGSLDKILEEVLDLGERVPVYCG